MNFEMRRYAAAWSIMLILGWLWFTHQHAWWLNVIAVPVIFSAPAVLIPVWALLKPRTRDKYKYQKVLHVPEFLDAVHAAIPGQGRNLDSALLENGRHICAIYTQDGDAGVALWLDYQRTHVSPEQYLSVTNTAIAARKYLCPGTDGRAPTSEEPLSPAAENFVESLQAMQARHASWAKDDDDAAADRAARIAKARADRKSAKAASSAAYLIEHPRSTSRPPRP